MAPGLTAAVTAAATAAAEREEAQEEAKAEAATAAATAEKEAAKAVVATEAVTLAAATAAAREARPSPSRPRRSPSLGHWTCCTRIRSLADELAETSAAKRLFGKVGKAHQPQTNASTRACSGFSGGRAMPRGGAVQQHLDGREIGRDGRSSAVGALRPLRLHRRHDALRFILAPPLL